MQKLQKQAISVSLKLLLGVMAFLLVQLLLMGCTSAPRKSAPEVWLIDPDDATLYRRINQERDKATKILGNQSMHRVRCVIDTEIDEAFEELIRDNR